MIKTLKTLAYSALATGATVASLNAAPVQDVSTNLFQPLTVTLSLYQQKAITSTADTINTGAAASFKTANLVSAVTSTLVTNVNGTAFSAKAAVGYVTIGKNSSNQVTAVVGLVESNTPSTQDLSSRLIPLTATTNYVITTNTVYQITNIYDTNGSITNDPTADTNTYPVSTNTGVNSSTNTLVFGGTGSNTISINVTNGTTNVTVITATSTNTYTNLSEISLGQTSATAGTNDLAVDENASLDSDSSTNSFYLYTNRLAILTNGGFASGYSPRIGTNSFSISTNVVVGDNVTNVDVIVTVGTESVVISTNSDQGTNTTTLVEYSGTNATDTNTYISTNALTNLVEINGFVLVSNGITSGFGTNQTLADSLSSTVSVSESTTNTGSDVLVTNYTTNVDSGITNVVINTEEVFTTNQIVTDSAVLTASAQTYSITNVPGIIGYTNTPVTIAAGPAQLVVEEPSGTGANATFIYTPIPPSVLSISNTPSTNDLIVATFKSTTTNEQDYSVKTLTLTATNVSLTVQGLDHSTLQYVTMADATLTGKKTAVTKQAWTDVSGYGTNAGAPIVLGGTIAVGAPATEKQP